MCHRHTSGSGCPRAALQSCLPPEWRPGLKGWRLGMEQLRGKQSLALERAMLLALTAGYRDIV
ncbi:MAG: hypothetical protein ACTHMA_02705, partial [Thermomicrobiales bacterium]